MSGAFKLPNKMEGERPFSLEASAVLVVEYLFVTLMLKLAYELSIKHNALTEKRLHIAENISQYQKEVEICESNLYVCEQSILKHNNYILEKEAEKKKLFDLRQEFLTIRAGQKLGDFPKTVDDIELREKFITDIYQFRFFVAGTPPPPSDANTIHLQLSPAKKALSCTLKTPEGSIVRAFIAVGALWLIKKEGNNQNLRCDLARLRPQNINIAEFCISLLENLAKKDLIPDPYEKELASPGEIKDLENLIGDTQTALEEMQCIKKDNILIKEECDAKLAQAQQELAAIDTELETFASHLPRQPLPNVSAEKSQYRLKVVDSCFFASRDYHNKLAAKKPYYQLEIVPPQFFGRRKLVTRGEDKVAFTLNK